MSTALPGPVIAAVSAAMALSGVSPRGPAAAVDASPAAAAPWTSSASAPAPPRTVRAPANGWQWPLRPQPEVTRGFAVGPQKWSAGHRGVDLSSVAGAPVYAAQSGVVTFAGTIAGVPALSITHTNGIRTTYQPVAAVVSVGAVVAAGQQVGTLTVAGGHCQQQACLHWGALRGEVYLNPLALLGFRSPILLPWK